MNEANFKGKTIESVVYAQRRKECEGNSSGEGLGRENTEVRQKVLELRRQTLAMILDLKHEGQVKVKKMKGVYGVNRVKPTNFVDSFTTESSLKRQIFSENEVKRQKIAKDFDNKSSAAVKATEHRVNSTWKLKISELMEVLQAKQRLLYEESESNSESLKSSQEKRRKRMLSEFENQKYIELNSKYREMYMQGLSNKQEKEKQASKESISKLISEIESEQYDRIKVIKECWKFDAEANCQKMLKGEIMDFEAEVKESERLMRIRAEAEVKQTVAELEKELHQALYLKYEEIDAQAQVKLNEFFESFKHEWAAELLNEPAFAKQQALLDQHKASISSKIKQDLHDKAFSEVMLSKNQIFEGVQKQLEHDFDSFQKQINEKTWKRLEKMETELQDHFFSAISTRAAEASKPIEVKLKMNYFKKLENLKSEIFKDLEVKYATQYKNFRRTVELEKISLCQYRANCNVYCRNLSKEVNELNKKGHEEKMKLTRRLNEPASLMSLKQSMYEQEKIEERGSEFVSRYPALNEADLEVISRPLLPPSVEDETIKVKKSERNHKITPSATEEMYSGLLGKTSKEAFAELMRKELSKSMSATVHQNVGKYETLLARHHKFIEPRKAK